jgi:hypothetical protein
MEHNMEKVGVGILLSIIVIYSIWAFIETYKEMNKDIRWYK